MLSFRFLATLITLQLTAFACASQMPGIDAVEISADSSSKGSLALAMDDIDDLSSDEYQAYKVSVKNNTDQWVRLDKINIAFPAFSTQPEVLLGKDLVGYMDSIQNRNTVDRYNKSVAIGSIYALGAVGAIAGAATGNDGVALTGLGAMGGSASYAAIDGVLNSKNKAEFQSTLPDQHLLRPFDIAPKMVVSRWIIVKIKKNVDYREARVELAEKDKPASSFLITSSKAAREALAVQPKKASK